jgi:hypothetical protein
MPTLEEPVNSLGEFTDRVSKIRQSWGLAKHKELWFRGESRDYGDTILRPELYRPPNVSVPLKPIWKLLNIENDFMRNSSAMQLSAPMKRHPLSSHREPNGSRNAEWISVCSGCCHRITKRILGNRHPAGAARYRKCPPAIPRLYEKLRGNEALTTTLSAVTAAVVGVVLIWPPCT